MKWQLIILFFMVGVVVISCVGSLVGADSVFTVASSNFHIDTYDSLAYQNVVVITVVEGSIEGYGTLMANDQGGVLFVASATSCSLLITGLNGYVVYVNGEYYVPSSVVYLPAGQVRVAWNLGISPSGSPSPSESNGISGFVLLFMVVGAVLAVGFGLFETVEKHKEVGVLIAVVGFILFVVFLFAIGVL